MTNTNPSSPAIMAPQPPTGTHCNEWSCTNTIITAPVPVSTAIFHTTTATVKNHTGGIVNRSSNDGTGTTTNVDNVITSFSEDTIVPQPDEETKKRTVLEEYVRCSESLLWKLMMSFYDREGVDSWTRGIVPNFITSNAFIARSYARVLSGYLSDMSSTGGLDKGEKFYIVELGAGSGKFSFLMLKALEEMKNTLPIPFENIVYVMTDFTESNVKFWRTHPALSEYVASGRLDFAIFDAVNDDRLVLQNSGVVLGGDEDGVRSKNPLCVVANYLFDTLCHDIFQVEGRVLKEGLISVGSERPSEPDPSDPTIINHLRNEYDYRPIDGNDYYTTCEDERDGVHLSRILSFYREYYVKKDPNHAGASILMPIGAIMAIRRLSNISSSRLLILSGDKGHNDPDQFSGGLIDPHLAVHGSFSVMVNYHAIGAYVTSRGGFAVHGRHDDASLKVSCFVLNGDDLLDGDGTTTTVVEDEVCFDFEGRDRERVLYFPSLSRSFANDVVSFGPNDFFVLQRGMKEESCKESLSLGSIVALLKLSDWDTDVFYKFRDIIIYKISTANTKLQNDLCRGVPRVWTNHYLLGRDKDVAFEMGRLYYGCQRPAEGLKFYILSSEVAGEHHVTYYNMGLCHYSLGEKTEAVACFEKSVGICAVYEKAGMWLEKVRKELEVVDGGSE